MSCHPQAYPEGHPEHKMSAALHALQPGSSVAIKGPCGTFRYQPGKYKAIGQSHHPFLLMTGTADAPSIMLSSTVHVWTAQRAPQLATHWMLREAGHLHGLKYHSASPSMVSCFMLAVCSRLHTDIALIWCAFSLQGFWRAAQV